MLITFSHNSAFQIMALFAYWKKLLCCKHLGNWKCILHRKQYSQHLKLKCYFLRKKLEAYVMQRKGRGCGWLGFWFIDEQRLGEEDCLDGGGFLLSLIMISIWCLSLSLCPCWSAYYACVVSFVLTIGGWKLTGLASPKQRGDGELVLSFSQCPGKKLDTSLSCPTIRDF